MTHRWAGSLKLAGPCKLKPWPGLAKGRRNLGRGWRDRVGLDAQFDPLGERSSSLQGCAPQRKRMRVSPPPCRAHSTFHPAAQGGWGSRLASFVTASSCAHPRKELRVPGRPPCLSVCIAPRRATNCAVVSRVGRVRPARFRRHAVVNRRWVRPRASVLSLIPGCLEQVAHQLLKPAACMSAFGGETALGRAAPG